MSETTDLLVRRLAATHMALDMIERRRQRANRARELRLDASGHLLEISRHAGEAFDLLGMVDAATTPEEFDFDTWRAAVDAMERARDEFYATLDRIAKDLG